jgi:hypothetical protein
VILLRSKTATWIAVLWHRNPKRKGRRLRVGLSRFVAVRSS